MPDFGRLVEANACVKKLLACFHGGYLWLDTKIPVTVELISQITGFPIKGPDPSQYFCGKDNEKWLAAKLKKKYGVDHDKREYVVNTIND